MISCFLALEIHFINSSKNKGVRKDVEGYGWRTGRIFDNDKSTESNWCCGSSGDGVEFSVICLYHYSLANFFICCGARSWICVLGIAAIEEILNLKRKLSSIDVLRKNQMEAFGKNKDPISHQYPSLTKGHYPTLLALG